MIYAITGDSVFSIPYFQKNVNIFYTATKTNGGFTYDMTRGYIGFSPRTVGDCQFLFSVQNTYGTVRFEGNKITLELLGAPLTIAAFGHPSVAKTLNIDGTVIDFQTENGITAFPEISIAKALEIELA